MDDNSRTRLDRKALAIFEALIDREPADRQNELARLAGGDAELIARVEFYLARAVDPDLDLETGGARAFLDAPEELLPQRVGPYRITGLIGRGGMGVVVRGERDDGVFDATVAIKLIRTDFASARARARFEDERRILARLRHPAIVRIIDGGEADGRPWLAMDFVEGHPVTLALEGATQDTRLDAFETVCDAVSHAHRNLTVHADIKPSNVLMTATGSIHLLDFGIARLLVDLDDGETRGPYPLTKGYAAPECSQGAAPTVASDVFSLGVLMLVMLGYDLPDDEAARVAGTRLPAGLLGGDLGAIAARALAEDPVARYPDVPALLDDIRRHRAHQPVSARLAEGWRYVAGRFVRRHRLSLGLTALAGFALGTAAIVSTAQYVRAESARAQADTRFLEMRKLARFMLFDHYDRLADAPGTVAARAQLASEAASYLDQLRRVPDAPADLRLETAQGYRRLATILGVSGVSSLGKPAEAAAALDRAEALTRDILARDARNAAALEELGWIEASRWANSANTAVGTRLRQSARARFAGALDLEPGRPGAILGQLTLDNASGFDLIYTENKPAEAVPVLRGVIARLQQVRFPAALRRHARQLEASAYSRLGDAIYYAGDMPGSLIPYRQGKAVAVAELARGPSVVWTDRLGEATYNIAGTLTDMPGQAPAALAELREGEAAMERVLEFGPDAGVERRLQASYGQHALALAKLGRFADAAAASQRSIGLREARLARNPRDPAAVRDLAIALPNHADTLAKAARDEEACRAAARAAKLWGDLKAVGNLGTRDAEIDVPRADAVRTRLCG